MTRQRLFMSVNFSKCQHGTILEKKKIFFSDLNLRHFSLYQNTNIRKHGCMEVKEKKKRNSSIRYIM